MPDNPPPVRIFVIEDDADHLAVLNELLVDEGYCVEQARDGTAALHRLLCEPHPDLVLVDLGLPGLDGWQLIAAMRGRRELATIPVVVITGKGPRVLSSAPVSAGYLEKPLTPARLLETIAACLARRGSRSLEVSSVDGSSS